MKQQKILVIGAGGQLGSELTQGLWRLYGKENVIATDIKPGTGVLTEGRFELLDALNLKALYEFIQKNEITQIYHLAAVLSATGEKNLPGIST
jgi:dTDP-4-dehydrorhamnose reductase